MIKRLAQCMLLISTCIHSSVQYRYMHVYKTGGNVCQFDSPTLLTRAQLNGGDGYGRLYINQELNHLRASLGRVPMIAIPGNIDIGHRIRIMHLCTLGIENDFFPQYLCSRNMLDCIVRFHYYGTKISIQFYSAMQNALLTPEIYNLLKDHRYNRVIEMIIRTLHTNSFICCRSRGKNASQEYCLRDKDNPENFIRIFLADKAQMNFETMKDEVTKPSEKSIKRFIELMELKFGTPKDSDLKVEIDAPTASKYLIELLYWSMKRKYTLVSRKSVLESLFASALHQFIGLPNSMSQLCASFISEYPSELANKCLSFL